MELSVCFAKFTDSHFFKDRKKFGSEWINKPVTKFNYWFKNQLKAFGLHDFAEFRQHESYPTFNSGSRR